MPIAKPTHAGLSPPGSLAASKLKTGMTKNKPNIRRAKINAKEKLARRSRGVIRKVALSDDIMG